MSDYDESDKIKIHRMWAALAMVVMICVTVVFVTMLIVA